MALTSIVSVPFGQQSERQCNKWNCHNAAGVCDGPRRSVTTDRD